MPSPKLDGLQQWLAPQPMYVIQFMVRWWFVCVLLHAVWNSLPHLVDICRLKFLLAREGLAVDAGASGNGGC